MEVHVSLVGRKDLTGEIYRQLRRAILDGRFPPGGRLPPTRELARRLNVSRTTVTVAYDRHRRHLRRPGPVQALLRRLTGRRRIGLVDHAGIGARRGSLRLLGWSRRGGGMARPPAPAKGGGSVPSEPVARGYVLGPGEGVPGGLDGYFAELSAALAGGDPARVPTIQRAYGIARA
jgi:hypothetical protein